MHCIQIHNQSIKPYRPFGYCSQPLIPSSSVDQTEVQFPARWTWLSDTVYSGSTKFHKKDVDLWTYVFNVRPHHAAYQVLELIVNFTMQDTASTTSSVHILGVSNRNPNVLKFYFMYTLNGAGFGLSVYDKFINGDPSESVFNIPNICKASGLERPARTNNSQTPMRPKLAESFSAKVSLIGNICNCITIKALIY